MKYESKTSQKYYISMFSKTLSSDSKSMSKTSTNPAVSVYAICMGVGGKGGGVAHELCLKLLTVKYNLQCKKTYFSGIFKPAISNKKTH